MILSDEQLGKIIEKHGSWRKTHESELDEVMDRRQQVSQEMRQLIEEVGILRGGAFSAEQLCQSVEIQKKVHNLSSMVLPRFLGYLNYSKYFKGFQGSTEDFKKEHPELQGPGKSGLGYPGADPKEFSTALGRLLTSTNDDFADALERVRSFEGVGLAISAGYLYLWDPNTYPLINGAATKAVDNIAELSIKQKKYARDESKKLLGIKKKVPQKINSYLRWYATMHEIRDNTSINNFHELDWFLWHSAIGNGPSDGGFWQIAPGEKAKLWEELLNESIAAVGYSKLDFDLTGKTKEELFKLYQEHYPDHSEGKRKIQAGQLWKFINLKPGEKFVTNKGKKLLLALGVVKSGYKFRPERKEYRHTVDVDYLSVSDDGIPIPPNFQGKFGKTIIPLKKQDFEALEVLFDDKGKQAIWWVNQGTTLAAENEGGFLWAPMMSKSGQVIYHWDTMEELKEGDIVLNYANGALRYVSEVVKPAVKEKRPESLKEESWEEEGRLVRVDYHELNPAIPLEKFSELLRKLNIHQGPIDSDGRVKQGYLFRLSLDALRIIKDSQLNVTWPKFVEMVLEGKGKVNTWIFQANPKLYDLSGALAELDELTWLVKQHASSIQAGDKVFIWEAGPEAGIVAYGTLSTNPIHMEQTDAEKKFVLKKDKFEGTQLRARAKIERVLPDRLKKEKLLAHPVLESLSILQAPQGSNFAVTNEQAQILLSLMKDGVINPEYHLSTCAEETGFDIETLERWVRAIERKGQAIVYGPPGTGKTFIAEKLAKHLIGGGDGFKDLVQFHPAYAYEDFMQGIRPKAREEGGLDYPVIPGRFLEFCQKSRSRKDKCVLIIDEINRANLARVFGELMYLLEYRDREIPLASGGSFRIPHNVRMIGTMNTADRSIALVDHALRRRFAFLALYPKYDILEWYHKDTGFSVEGLINTLTQLNTKIADPHYEVGITFFLRNDLAEQIEDIWRMEVEPYLEEYFFDQREKVSEFRWEKIKDKMTL